MSMYNTNLIAIMSSQIVNEGLLDGKTSLESFNIRPCIPPLFINNNHNNNINFKIIITIKTSI